MQDIGCMTIEALEKELALFSSFIAQFGDTYLSDEGLKRLTSLRSELDARRQRESTIEIRVWIPEPGILNWNIMVPVMVATEFPGELLWWKWQGSLLLAKISFESPVSDEEVRRATIEERAEAALQELGCHPMRREREWCIEKAPIRFWVSKEIYTHIGVDLKKPQIALDIAFVHPDGTMTVWEP